MRYVFFALLILLLSGAGTYAQKRSDKFDWKEGKVLDYQYKYGVKTSESSDIADSSQTNISYYRDDGESFTIESEDGIFVVRRGLFFIWQKRIKLSDSTHVKYAVRDNILYLQNHKGGKVSYEIIEKKPNQSEFSDEEDTSDNDGQWKAASFEGLALGTSTYDDVKRSFGEPSWEGDTEDKVFDADSEYELMLTYGQNTHQKGPITFILGKETRVLKALHYIPMPEMSVDEALEEFGNEFFIVEPGVTKCGLKEEARGMLTGKPARPFSLVYPEKGMYVSITHHDTVLHVGFLYRCVSTEEMETEF